MSARWVCKMCQSQGLGGPDGWERHRKATHVDDARLGATVSFGFAPNYASGRRTSHRLDYVMPPRAGADGA